MSGDRNRRGFTIREIATRSGVSEGALRMWETRYGFPNPQRLASGHRRYSELELERVQAVVRARDDGLSLPRAIEHARTLADRTRPSVFSTLRETFPHLQPQLFPKRAMVALSHAIEDECNARAQQPLLIGAFQQERFYRQAESRWRELARTARGAFVMADFANNRRPRDAPAEISVPSGEPLTREWVLVCEADEFCACLVASERLGRAYGERAFEAVWTVEPVVVRVAARACCELAARSSPQVVEPLRERLATPAPPSTPELRAAIELSTRILRYAAIGEDPSAEQRSM